MSRSSKKTPFVAPELMKESKQWMKAAKKKY